MTTLQVILALFVILGIFTVVRQVIRSTLESEWLSEMYLRWIRSRSLARAIRREGKPQIDEEYYKFKLAQLSAKAYEKRELALDYFDNVPADPRLAETLIEILPIQHRKDLQERMVRLLYKTLDSLTEREKRKLKDGKIDQPYPTQRALKEWNISIAVWVTEVILIAILWLRFKSIPFSIIQILFLCIALFSIMIGALIIVIKDWRRVGQVTLLASALLLSGLWLYSKSMHAGMRPVTAKDLTTYGIPGVRVHINYPGWLTADDIGLNKKLVFISVIGNKSVSTEMLTISFTYDPAILKITNKDGTAISPRFETTMANPVGEPKEFYVHPIGRRALKRGFPETTIFTQIETKTIAMQEIPELKLNIQLEDPIWKTIRDIFLYLIPTNFGGAVLWFLWDRLRKSKK